MADALRLVGFRHSVYTWVVRLTLRKLGMTAAYTEADPFADPPDPVLARFTPLGRVPVLVDGDFTLTETAAILRYLDGRGEGPSLQPRDLRALARMAQVMGLVDADVYPVLVRRVFSPGYYTPHVMGQPSPPGAVADGIAAAPPVLSVLEGIAAEGLQLRGETWTLADLHLAPMIDYFTRVPEGATLLEGYPALSGWWRAVGRDPDLRATDPLGPR